jgi:hypothetical protein
MTRSILFHPEIGAAAGRLSVYDVEQGAWEQESHGYIANATHVLTHLAKGLTTKDFLDAEIVQGELAPDSVQYALRLMRWTGQTSLNGAPGPREIGYVNDRHRLANFASMPRHQIAYMGATARLAAGLHDEGHESTRARAEDERNFFAKDAAKLLLYSASLQADAFNFDLAAAFDHRLSVLREHFGIPDPDPGTNQLVS